MQPEDKIPFVFLTSHAFSGSTLLGFLMDMHPEVATVGELTGPARHIDLSRYPCSCGRLFQADVFWQEVSAVLNEYGVPYSLNQYFGTRFELSSHRARQRLLAGSLRNTFIENWRDRVIFTLRPSFRRRLVEQATRNELFARAILAVTGKSVFLDTSKNPMRIRYLQLSPHIELYVIHLVRDVRGVVTSIMSRHPDTAVQQAARSWIAREKNIQRHLKTIPPSRQIQIRYEALVTDTLPVLNRILTFIGVDPLAELGNYREVEHHILGNKMRKQSSAEIKLDERWRTVLSEKQLQIIANMVGVSE